MKNSVLLSFAVGALLLGSACSKKPAECNALAGLLNGTIDKIKAQDVQATDSLDVMKTKVKAQTEVFATFQTELGKIEITTPEVLAIRGEYQAVATELIASSKATSEVIAKASSGAGDEGLKAEAAAADKKTDESTAKLDGITGKLNKTCQ